MTGHPARRSSRAVPLLTALSLAASLAGGCATTQPATTAPRSRLVLLSPPPPRSPPPGPPADGQGPCRSLSWPIATSISSGFGPRDGRQHLGIDLVVPQGTPVRVACDGIVAYAGTKLRGYGRLLIVKHGGGLSTVYAHNRELLVGEGARVARGQVIALSGATGHVTAPHLHFEVRVDGVAIDPVPLLPRLQAWAGW